MPTVQRLPASGMSGCFALSMASVDDGVVDQFPAGLRVLVVDDDATCLILLEKMLKKCNYHVTTCCRATIALSLLRERKGTFDLVISDVHMPDMDGFKLLEHVGLEMDLPVIMMSGDGRTSLVMRGIKHGACDYLIKPVRMEELKNIWQHVIRKKWSGNKEHEHSGSVEDSDRQRHGTEEAEYASSVNDGTDSSWKAQKKKRDSKEDEDDGELDNDDPSATKKPRVVWSVELHQQFVSAVNQLGIDKAVPKRILELMNVPGLTRENVASHLQKFRLYLKRLSGVTQHQGGIPHSYCGSVDTDSKVNPLGRLDFQSFAASGQIPPQTLAAYHAEMLGRPSSGMMMSGLDQPSLQTSIAGVKYIPVEPGVSFGQPLHNCHSAVPEQFPQANVVFNEMSSGIATRSPNLLGPAGPTGNLVRPNSLQNGNLLSQILPQQQYQPVPSESAHPINVQPSCLVVPSQPSNNYNIVTIPESINANSVLIPAQPSNLFQVGGNGAGAPVTQNSSFSSGGTTLDYNLISSQSNISSLGVRQVMDGDFKSVGLLNGYSIPGSVPSSMPSSIVGSDSGSTWRLNTSTTSIMDTQSSSSRGPVFNFYDIHSSGESTGVLPDQGPIENIGYVGKGMSIPSRFAIDDIELSAQDLIQNKRSNVNGGSRGKQATHLDFVGQKVGNSAPHFSAGGFVECSF